MAAREDYRDKAEGCLRAAESLRNPSERMKLLEVARGYVALARHVAARQEQGTAHRSPEYVLERNRHGA